ncbi:MAG: DUF4440 domain-containing protein, partial [Sedimentisphaerales bacterium]|nr:DUF4440 domain-containing protein [Sedimentisphaerales bacterium]
MITNWLDYVNQHDVDKVVELYADDATLWGTFSEIRRDGRTLVREYFRHFLNLDSLEAAVTQITRRHLGDVTLYSGQYVFRYRQDGADRQVR